MPKRSRAGKPRPWLVLPLVLGCGAEAEPRAPTYHEDVAPLLAEHCVSCHQADGPGPFSLVAPDDAVERASAIAAAVRAHRMPPFPADDAECRPIRDARRLDGEAIETLVRWADGGAPLGNAPASQEVPRPPAYGALDHVDAVLRPTEPYVPRGREDDHRCFPVDPALDEDAYLTAYAVREDVPGIVHHVQLWALDDPAADAMVQALDAADEGPGYACPWGHGVPARYVSVWAPSDPVRRHPQGTGILLSAGRRMIVQVHYHDDRAQGLPDQAAIELQLEPRVERAASMWVVSNGEIELPPGVADTSVVATQVASEAATLWGVRAHMHALGARASVGVVTATDGESCLLEIPRWRSGWQLMYFYEEPVALAVGDTLQVDCRYDTRGQDAPVRYGIGTADEMCFGFFYVTAP